MTKKTEGSGMGKWARVLGAVLALVPGAVASAQETPKGDVYDQFFRYTETENKVVFQERPGETVDPFTGNLGLTQVDLALPGKAGLDLRIVRTYSSKIWGRADLLVAGEALLAEKAASVLGYGWTFHMGRLINPDGTGDSGSCGSNVPVFEGGDGGSRSFYKSAWNSAVLVSKDYWRYERNCEAMNGGGACAWSDTGIRYEFSSAADEVFYVGTAVVWPLTGIVDPYGNRISVSYVTGSGDVYQGTGAVDTITDTWGRTVKFTYQTSLEGHAVEDGRRLQKMTVSGGGESMEYTYGYEWVSTGSTQGADKFALPGTGRFFLRSVQPPAGPAQTYEYAWAETVAKNQYALKKVTYPGGGTTEYVYSPVSYFTGREVVPFSVVTSRVVGGREVTPATWSYAYVSPTPVTPEPPSAEQYPFHVTTITRPDGKQDVHTMYGFGWIATKSMATPGLSYAFLVGLTRKVSRADGAEVEEFGWNPRTEAPVTTAAAYSAPVYSDTCGAYFVWDDVVLAPALARRVLWRDGAAYVTDSADFDAYGQPRTVTENGYQASSLSFSDGRDAVPLASGGTQTRVTTWTYKYYPDEKNTGRPLNLVRGLPATQKVCVGSDCVDNSWVYEESATVAGYPMKAETRAGVTTTFGYQTSETEGLGNLKSVTNALGKTLTLTGYGPGWGIPTAIDFNGAFSVTREAYWQGWVKSVTDGRQNKTSYAYDAIGRPTAVTPPRPDLNVGTTIEYALDNSFVNTLRGAYMATSWFDGLGRTTASSDTEGVSTTVRYDAMGQAWFKSYPFDETLGEIGEKQYLDGLGRAVAQERAFRPEPAALDQSGTCETPDACMVWNTHANNCVRTDVERGPNDGTSTLRCGSSFGSPEEQRLGAVADAHGNVWQYTYGVAGNVQSVLAPLSQGNRSYTYEPVTRFLESETTGESGKTTYTRNAVGQPLTRTDARAVVATYGYKSPTGVDDPLSRLRSVKYGSGSADDVTQSWDAANNLETIASLNGGSYTFEYDELNRIKTQTWVYGGVSYTTRYRYDAQGCLDQLTQPTGTVLTMTCDTLSRTTSVMVGSSYVVDQVAYHPSGQVKRMEYSNGIDTEFQHDGRGRTEWITSGPTSGGGITPTVMRLHYTYDGADNVATFENELNPGSALTMAYDALDRLETASGPDKGTPEYRYDGLGNRKFKLDGTTGQASTYEFDTATNRLAKATVQTPLPSLKLTWDLAGRLSSTSDGTTYKYDARGKRVSRTSGGVTVVYHYDAAGRVIAETTPAGAKLRDYVYVGNRLVVVDGCTSGDAPCAATREWYHSDTLGSVLARTNAAGGAVASLDYLPWGEQFGAGFAGAPGDRQYNGRVYDAGTGFHDYGARMYWPEIGRFVSADSVMGEPAAPGTLNRYSYVLNNPYKYVDPTGNYTLLVFPQGDRNRGVPAAAARLAQKMADVSLDESRSMLVRGGAAFLGAVASLLDPETVDRTFVIAGAAGSIKTVGGKVPTELALLNKKLASEAQVAELTTGGGAPIAGAGTRVTLRAAPRLAREYGGKPEDWAKVRSSNYKAEDGTSFETHANRNTKTGEVVELKTKFQ